MKYHNHLLKKVMEADVEGGHYFDIYKDGKFVTSAWTLSNAKEFIDSYNGITYNWNVLG